MNANGVPFGSPDKKIKCALFRVINPRTDTYANFREDVDKGGLETTAIDNVGWPMRIFIQQGPHGSLVNGKGLDTNDLDGYVNGLLSHDDLMWPYRDEVADFLKERVADDGTIHAKDVYDGKMFAAKKYNMTISIASYLEVPLVFLKCGGDADTGRVPLKSILEFYDGVPPSTDGRVVGPDMKKVLKSLGTRRRLRAWIPNVFKLLFTKGFPEFLVGAGLAKSGKMQKKLGLD